MGYDSCGRWGILEYPLDPSLADLVHCYGVLVYANVVDSSFNDIPVRNGLTKDMELVQVDASSQKEDCGVPVLLEFGGSMSYGRYKLTVKCSEQVNFKMVGTNSGASFSLCVSINGVKNCSTARYLRLQLNEG